MQATTGRSSVMGMVIRLLALLGLIMVCNAAGLWIYDTHYANKWATVDLDDVLKDHVNRYGRIGLSEKQTASIAQTFGHALESRLEEYQAMGYQVLVKQAVVKGTADDLTLDLKNRIEADIAPLVQKIQASTGKQE